MRTVFPFALAGTKNRVIGFPRKKPKICVGRWCKPFSLYFRQEGLVCLYVGRRFIRRNSRNGGMAERRNGGNGGTAERMAEWQNGRNGYIRTIYGRHTHTDNDTDDDTDNDTLIFYSIEKVFFRMIFMTDSFICGGECQRSWHYGRKHISLNVAIP